MLTEFFTCRQGPASDEAILKTIKTAEENLVSWIGWEYKSFAPWIGCGVFNQDGSVDEEAIKMLRRPYAVAVAGMTTY